MELQTQFYIVFLLGIFVGTSIIGFLQRIVVAIWVKYISDDTTKKIGKSFQEKLDEKIKENANN